MRRRPILATVVVAVLVLTGLADAPAGGGETDPVAAASYGPLDRLGTAAGSANDVADDGTVVGRAFVGGRHAAVTWDADETLTEVGPDTGDAEATGTNARGDVVGTVGSAGTAGWDEADQGFVVHGDTGTTELLTLAGANAIDDDGVAVGYGIGTHEYGFPIPYGAAEDVDDGTTEPVDGEWLADVEHGHAVGYRRTQESCPYYCDTIDATRYDPAFGGARRNPFASLGPAESQAHGVGPEGQVVGTVGPYMGATFLGPDRAYVELDGVLRELLPLPGGTVPHPVDIGPQGVVVGWSEDSAGRERAVVWVPGDDTARDLGTLGGNGSRAFAVNATGLVVGTAQDVTGTWYPFRLQLPAITARGTIAGTVRDPEGDPVPGSRVRLYDGGLAVTSALVESDGSYEVLARAGVPYEVRAEPPAITGLLPATASASPVQAVAGAAVTGIDVDVPRSPTGTVEVLVLDHEGEPFAGANVRTYPVGGTDHDAAGATGPDGRASLAAVPVGDHHIRVDPGPGVPYTWHWYLDSTDRAGATPLAVVEGTPASATVQLPVDESWTPSISGRVTGPDGTGLANVTLAFFDADDTFAASSSAVTRWDGSWTVADLPPQTYKIRIRAPFHPGLLEEWYDDSPTRRDAVPLVVEGTHLTGIDIQLHSDRQLSGVVTASGGGPVESAVVMAYAPEDRWVPSASTTTGAGGTWSLADLPGTEYRLRIEPPAGSGLGVAWFDGAERRTDAAVVRNDAGEVAGLDVTLPTLPATELTGTVIDPGDAPVPNARIQAFGPGDTWVASHMTTSDANGGWSMSGLAVADHRVRFVAPPGSGLANEWHDDAVVRPFSDAVGLHEGVPVALLTRLEP